MSEVVEPCRYCGKPGAVSFSDERGQAFAAHERCANKHDGTEPAPTRPLPKRITATTKKARAKR